MARDLASVRSARQNKALRLIDQDQPEGGTTRKDPRMNANTSPLRGADDPDAAAQAAPALSPFGHYCASVLAATAIESGVDEDGIRRLFARCAEAGYGFAPECEAAVLSEHAALRA
jgi:hypothetical protein